MCEDRNNFCYIRGLFVDKRHRIDLEKNKTVVEKYNEFSILIIAPVAGPGKFELNDLYPALSLCTHLIYGFAGIDAKSFEVISLNPHLDTGEGYSHYKLVTQMKRNFTNLKVYLGIGGNADPDEKTHKYLSLTENSESRKKFIDSVGIFLSDYEFDGIDLAWQFPSNMVKNLGSRRRKVKNIFGRGNFKDKKQQEHRDGFAMLVHDLKTLLLSKKKNLTLTVLPLVNSSIYYNVSALAPNLDAVHLMTFDQKTPEQNPNEADFPAPISNISGRAPDTNIDFQTRYWLDNKIPGSKIVIGIPTFGRTWKLRKGNKSGIAPQSTNGPGAEGPLSHIPGVLSYSEICSRLLQTSVNQLTRVDDPTKENGIFAYNMKNSKTGEKGMWVGYDDTKIAENKTLYAKTKGLGGIAIYELSLDDFQGVCTGDKFPILRAAASKLVTQ